MKTYPRPKAEDWLYTILSIGPGASYFTYKAILESGLGALVKFGVISLYLAYLFVVLSIYSIIRRT